ncbi:hypothetical protein AXG55_07035 [Silvanigrella aquatica]|uniref:Lipid/polyisoprenoid-binding YceI-like domain-containing protein n=2 Tax=Silvanigrella aquatica TaxID=1915309 RepID=A0A1L4D4J6_9BACT|nr:hypothetical protein AXG55_07035 [Silvanigrella aquatica]
MPLFANSTPIGKYSFDQSESKMEFHINNFGVLTVDGKFKKFSGTIIFNPKFEKSQVEASAEISSIDTDNSSRDKHLKSIDFFDQEKFSKMTFKSKRIEGNMEIFKLIGDLTIKKITKEVIFSVENKGNINRKEEFNFIAQTDIKRNDFDIKYGSTISDNVKIKLEIHAVNSKNSSQGN